MCRALDEVDLPALQAALEAELASLAAAWYPRTVDERHGGFLCNFDYAWRAAGSQRKMLEYQARLTRVAARAARRPGLAWCAAYAEHGFRYLAESLWDHTYGGFFQLLDREGAALNAGTKNAHGSFYAVTACVEYFALRADERALDLARRAFLWLDEHAYDPRHGGYFGYFCRDGTPILDPADAPLSNAARDPIGTPIGLKDANTNIDALVTIGALREVADDVALQGRFAEQLDVICTRLVAPPGAISLWLTSDWRPVPEPNRYGYSLTCCNALRGVLHQLDGDSRARAVQTMKSLVDMLLRHAWEPQRGGFAYGGSTYGPLYVEDMRVAFERKYWWLQAEGLPATLALALLFPDEEAAYVRTFARLWRYIERYLVDRK